MAGTYALDIENRRVQNAMAHLGIEESELLIKCLDDFAGPRISPEIQELRFNYHKKKLQETVKKIKYRIREDRQRMSTVRMEGGLPPVKSLRSAPISSRELVKSESLASFLVSEEAKLQQIKEKQKQLLLKTYLQTQPSSPKLAIPAIGEEDEREPGVKDKMAKKKADFEKKKQKHKDKIEEIRREKMEMQRELVKTMTQNMREHEERGRKYEAMKRAEVLARAVSYQEKKREIAVKLKDQQSQIEESLDKRLKELEERIEKNRRLHSEELRTKSERAGKWGRGDVHAEGVKGSEEVERIKQYVTAQMLARGRKQELATKQQSEFEAQRKKAETKLATLERIKKEENDTQAKKIHFLERKMKKAAMVMEEKKKEWGKELELRMEQQRLLDEDKRTKVERAQRIYNLRREKLLDKLLMDKEKVEKIKKDQTLRTIKHQETAIKIMIEKERTKEIQSIVAKSPMSKAAQERLKMLEIKVKPDEYVATEEKAVKE